ncbi:MAG: transposase [Solirubrobacteraceae bacterium]
MLTLLAEQQECLWDEALPIEVKELPDDLAALDRLLADPAMLGPIVERFRREVIEERRAVLSDGRPTIAMETYVRLMVLKQRYRWGYRSLVAEVPDSIHLRRFCRISLSERVPADSTVRKLTRRIGPDTVNEITRVLIVAATRSKRFRPRAVRIDSTVIEADVKYPTDSGLAAHGVKVLAREAQKLAKLVKERKRRVRDRSRMMGRTLRARGHSSVCRRGRSSGNSRPRPRGIRRSANRGERITHGGDIASRETRSGDLPGHQGRPPRTRGCAIRRTLRCTQS